MHRRPSSPPPLHSQRRHRPQPAARPHRQRPCQAQRPAGGGSGRGGPLLSAGPACGRPAGRGLVDAAAAGCQRHRHGGRLAGLVWGEAACCRLVGVLLLQRWAVREQCSAVGKAGMPCGRAGAVAPHFHAPAFCRPSARRFAPVPSCKACWAQSREPCCGILLPGLTKGTWAVHAAPGKSVGQLARCHGAALPHSSRRCCQPCLAGDPPIVRISATRPPHLHNQLTRFSPALLHLPAGGAGRWSRCARASRWAPSATTPFGSRISRTPTKC